MFNREPVRRLLLALLFVALLSSPSLADAQAAWSLTAARQPIQAGYVTLDAVTAARPAWVVVSAEDGETILGQTLVEAGTHAHVPVRIDALRATPTLRAWLAADEGQTGVYEASDPAQTTPSDFAVFGLVLRDEPRRARDVTEVVALRVIAQRDGWVVVGLGRGEPDGPVAFGLAPVSAGVSEDVRIPIENPAQLIGRSFDVTLHVDAGEIGTFEFPGPDIPALPEDGVVQNRLPRIAREPLSFGTTFIRGEPALITAEDRTLIVPAAASPDAGFLVLRTGGARSQIIGSAPITAGVNTDVAITIPSDVAVPGSAFLEIFSALPAAGEALEPPDFSPDTVEVLLSDGIMIGTQNRLNNQTQDAITAIGGIVIGRVVASQDVWLEVVSSAAGLPTIAVAPLPAGISRNVVIPIPADASAPDLTLLIRMHRDAGQPGVYEFPGPDEVLRDADGTAIQSGIVVQ